MADTMTLPLEGKNALSLKDGVQALQSQRKTEEPSEENTETDNTNASL